MRMKFNKSSQLLLVSAISLLVAGLITACGTLTTDFVYVASTLAAGPNSYGQIDVYEIDSESGHMRPLPSSPFPSGGRYPIAEAVSSDYANLYVVNQDDNSIVQFLIGNDGKLYPQNTVNTPGIFPLGVAVNGSYLYVLDTYQPLPTCSPASPCSGSIAVYPVSAAAGSDPGGKLGSPVPNGSLTYWPLMLGGSSAGDIIVPTGVNVLKTASSTYVYVSAYDTTAKTGYVFAYTSSAGVLTPLNGSPYAAGTYPSAVASSTNSNGSFVYVTDQSRSNVLAYAVSSGQLTPLSGSPFPSGNTPLAIVADSAFPFLYVANSTDSNVSAYSIGSDGKLTQLGTYATGLQPVAIGIDPSTNHFVYTANFLANSVSGFELSETAGTLLQTQRSPFGSNANPDAVAAIPHGSTKK